MVKLSFKLILSTSIFLFSLSLTFGQQTINKTLIHDGETREYTVYIPASYQANIEVPLLFNFHGGSGDIASQIAIADMSPIADTANFIVVYPQAFPDPNDGGSTNWTHKPPTDHDDIFFVEAMIDSLAAEYSINQDRVYGCGYSNGGEFAFELACRLSHRVAAIGVVARPMYIETLNNCSPTHPIGIVTIHGTNDDYDGIIFGGVTYYISLDDVNTYWSDYNNTNTDPTIIQLPNTNTSDGSTVEHHSWENGDECVAVEHFKVIGGGHDWPGSFGNMDIDASLEIWNYVSQYNRNGLINCTPTSISEIKKEEFSVRVFPNPANDFLMIEMDNDLPETFQLFSLQGKLILSGIINSTNQTIDLSGLASSVYFLKIGGKVLRVVK